MGADGARKRKIAVITALAAAVLLLVLLELLVGSSGMSVRQCVSALFGSGDSAAVRLMQHIRLPRLLAAVIAGAGLSVSGLIMQTVLGNPMASPATLGVSNAAVFGANLSIIALSGGFLSTGNNLTSYTAGADPFATSALAFVFAAGSVLVVLALCRLRDFSPNVVVLAGIALGSVWTAATTILQFYATDVGLSAAVIWSFGDLGRATYRADWIMLAVTAAGIAVFAALAWRYNALLSGGDAAGKRINDHRLADDAGGGGQNIRSGDVQRLAHQRTARFGQCHTVGGAGVGVAAVDKDGLCIAVLQVGTVHLDGRTADLVGGVDTGGRAADFCFDERQIVFFVVVGPDAAMDTGRCKSSGRTDAARYFLVRHIVLPPIDLSGLA